MPHKYDGDPLELEAFINSVELVKELAGNNHGNLFLQLVKSKLTKKAIEAMPKDAVNVDQIINGLKDNIKPDNSKVLAGRLLALRADKSKLTEFSDQAQELAEALQRSLIIEGIPQNKAREMTIERTVELCRNAARSDLVKSVLASANFNTPQEVVSKFIVEANTDEKEKQILSIKSYNNNRNNKNKYNNYQNNNNYRGKKRYNNNNNGNNSRQYNNNYNQNRNNNNNRGRRNYNNYNNNNNRNYNNDQRNVRYAENWDVPQLALGDVQNQNQQ